ncbi:substrate-binding periplasmic protein [Pseudoalteromonas sp. SSDWG2]|uniref:substrate-binding periplasmic protein n=1 Tax=Pseudoalteromonas sp. SSDWG2 TaxID=3139391 RepID=UPI003BAB82E4
MLFEKLNKCVHYVRLPSSVRLLTELEAGRIDIVPGASYTAQRLKYGVYSQPYRVEEVRMMIRQRQVSDTHARFEDLLSQKRSLVLNAAAYYGPRVNAILNSEQYASQIVDVSAPLQRYRMLAAGRVDMSLEDKFVAQHLLNLFPATDIVLHPDILATEDIYFMISHKLASKSFMAEFNRTITENSEAIAHILSQGNATP